MKLLLIIIIISILIFVPGIHKSQSVINHGNVLIINLTEEIDPGSSNMFHAMSKNYSAVVIYMNTPGGILENMLQMVNCINKTEQRGIPVYTYVPDDGMAASAGSYVAMASDYIYMGSGSYIGPSTPIVVGGTPLEENHTKNAMAALMESMAIGHKRNETAAYSMVINNTAYTSNEAYKIGLINGICNNFTEFLKDMVHGRYIYVNENLYDQFLSFLSNPEVSGLLILIGFFAILIDLYHGSIILSVIGITSIILGFLGAELIDASIVGIILLILGAVLMMLEFKTNHGIALLSGLLTGSLGIYFLASPYYSSNPGYSPSPYGYNILIAIIIILILGFIFIYYISRIYLSQTRRRYTGSESIVGQTGYSLNDIPKNGTGQVSIDGVAWEAINKGETEIKRNDEIVVLGRSGLKLIIKKH
ncbi:NfeD family protein [Picrophilus oshimae]|uniref:Serine protease n=1 Tax=Picrophilus torridus (strain ATCC 700027 / DSM 9790 / JCM 10055 / NBRC 100828 / KAW 2/3) TaxID=1122961 RepID=Q6KZQ2_PICTO|nr:nodulation protein NfeD [Picrophilus oshimae]AAT43800.1 putative serine protease [Picrophilus oshimae DSM 9789]